MSMMMILVRCFTTHTKIAACFGFLLRLKLAKPSKNIQLLCLAKAIKTRPPIRATDVVLVVVPPCRGTQPGTGYSRQAVTAYPLPGCAGSLRVCVLVCWCATDPTCVVRLSDCCQSHCHCVCLSHCLFVNCNAPSLSVFAAVFCFFFFCMWRCDENCPCWMGNWGIEEPCMEQGSWGATRQGRRGTWGWGWDKPVLTDTSLETSF